MKLKDLIGKRQTQETTFMGSKILISKLTVEEVLAIQERAKANEGDADATAGFELLKHIISSSVEDGKDLTDENFKGFPMDELSKLSNAIMVFSGLGDKAPK